MKHLLILVIAILCIAFSSCTFRTRGTGRPHRAFVIPAYKSKHHWGAPRYWTRHTRYWSKHRYGMRPHPRRGAFR